MSFGLYAASRSISSRFRSLSLSSSPITSKTRSPSVSLISLELLEQPREDLPSTVFVATKLKT